MIKREDINARVLSALTRLNDLYGRGRVRCFEWNDAGDGGMLWRDIPITQHTYTDERRRFRFNGRTVSFCGHQQCVLGY
jgi:hypothetical protein